MEKYKKINEKIKKGYDLARKEIKNTYKDIVCVLLAALEPISIWTKLVGNNTIDSILFWANV